MSSSQAPPPPHSLLSQQIGGELLLVSEAAQGVHALQDVGVDLLGRGQRPEHHLPGVGLLRLRLVLPSPATQTPALGRGGGLGLIRGGGVYSQVPGVLLDLLQLEDTEGEHQLTGDQLWSAEICQPELDAPPSLTWSAHLI